MSNNPFDFTKIFNQYDPATAMNEQMQKMFSQFSLPNVDSKALAEAQQKNLEAVTAANRAAVEGMQEMMKCQAKIMQEAIAESSNMVKNLKVPTDPAELSQKQSVIIDETMQKALANATDLGEIVTKTQKETSKLITERFDAAMKELKDSVEAK